jgi:hypothetical protein
MPDYPPAMTRAYLGLPDRFLFLLIFDFLSVVERKNPVGLVKAFTRAFAENEGPLLVLKSINGDLKISDLERLRAAAAGRSDVMLIDGYYSAEEKNALLGACDCYVSLHRAEGLGLTMAEAMMLGKPVIATAYSGNLHFMTPEDSYLVDYTRCRVPPGCEPYETRSSWADPDLDQAARYMREVFEHPNEAARTGQRARANVIARHGIATSARAITQRLEAIRDERRSRVRMASREAAQDPTPSSSSVAGTTERLDAPKPDLAGTQVMHPESNVHAVDAVEVERLEASLEGLDELAALRLSTEGRPFPRLRRAAQGALFRLLRPVTFQRRQFHTRLIEALRQSAVALRAEQARAAPLEQRLAQLTARQRDLHGVLGSLQAGSATFQTSAAAHLAALKGAVQTLESRTS